MNLRIPHHISRTFIQAHTEWFFVFSNDLMRKGMLGQAWSGEDEPNAFRYPVLYKFCSNPTYFTDGDMYKPDLDSALKDILVLAKERPIIPFLKMGCGASKMKEYCPKLWAYMNSEINRIKYPEIEYIYA